MTDADEILVLAPHPDDEAIGCGGVIRIATAEGHAVHVLYLTSGEAGLDSIEPTTAAATREREAAAACEILGVRRVTFLRGPDGGLVGANERIVARLSAALAESKPTTVYLPHPNDAHPDHQVVLSMVQAASVGLSGPGVALVGYEVWTPIARPDWVIDITDVMDVKLQAVRAHRSQLELLRYDRAVQGLNSYRGELAARARYAEGFVSL